MKKPKLTVKETIIVEGKYDKIKLASIIDANIITTEGFGIFKNSEKLTFIKALAEKTGVIILTDSDTAGGKIRSYLKGAIPKANVVHVYVPEIFGKEKRKAVPSKENLLGVEGIDSELIRQTFERFGISTSETSSYEITETETQKITKLDFYTDGFLGQAMSSRKREKLCEKLQIPHLSSNALLDAANVLLSYSEYKQLVQQMKDV